MHLFGMKLYWACVCQAMILRFALFLLVPTALFTDQPNIEKRSNKVCYSVLRFKNYFATVFSAISFQFLAK